MPSSEEDNPPTDIQSTRVPPLPPQPVRRSTRSSSHQSQRSHQSPRKKKGKKASKAVTSKPRDIPADPLVTLDVEISEEETAGSSEHDISIQSQIPPVIQPTPPPIVPITMVGAESSTAGAPKTMRELLEKNARPVPEITETPAERAAREARMQAGAATDADMQVASAIAARDAIIAANAADIAAYAQWSLASATERQRVNAFTAYDAHGIVIMPPAGTRPAPDNILARNYVNATTVNLLDAPPEFVDLCAQLDKLNGEDAYSNEAVALGRLAESEYLILPAGFPHPTIPDDVVGTRKAKDYFSIDYLWGVYVLNKSVHTDTNNHNDVKFALARMEAVKMGWWNKQRETKLAQVPRDYYETVIADGPRIREYAASARDAAWIVPLCSEHTFRTKGHHFITGQMSEYVASYTTIFKAVLKPDVGSFLPPDVLYHKLFHWISPGRTWRILAANKDTELIPAAIKLRLTSAPAGAAIVSTTAAVIRSLQAGGLYDDLVKANICDLSGILSLDGKIRANPVKYHRIPSAYDMPPLAGDELAELTTLREEAEKFGPFAKAFCETLLKNAPLGKQKVLTKVSQLNPTVNAKARKYFIGLARETPKTIEEVFAKKRKLDTPVGLAEDDEAA